MKKILFLFILLILFLIPLVPGVLAAAQPRSLEITYPTVPGATPPTTVETEVPEYVKYIFNFLIVISGLVALGVIIYAGFQYFTSVGDPGKMQDSRDRILSALLGLVILVGSWLILMTINPQLLVLTIKPIPFVPSTLYSGVYLCTEQAPIIDVWNEIKQDQKPTEEDLKILKSRSNALAK